ncbi:hypothetical protein B0H14DRAFT_2579817 [Mycena olivaceomarginata]|nr:hypothetical protein B0H14DRAFT_2579817 [Mycena olivaceomarginata]
MPSILRTLLINSFNDNPIVNIIVSPLLSPPDDLNKPKALNSSNVTVIDVTMQGGTGGHGGHGINGSGGTGGLGEAPYLVRSAGTVIINPPLLAPPDSDTALVSVAQFVAILEALESRGDDNDVGDFTRVPKDVGREEVSKAAQPRTPAL